MTQSPQPPADLEFAKAAAQLAAHTRCTDVVLLDVSGRSQVTHYFLIATGTSPRQMTTVAEQIAELGEQMGFKPWRTSGAENAKWILIDCVDVVVHLFDAPSRTFYDLEMLWGDCPRVELDLPAASIPQTDQTQAALEAIEEVIEAIVDVDDEMTMMEITQEASDQEDLPSLPTETDMDEGITAPPDDHAIRYESVSIQGTNGDEEPIPATQSTAKPRATSRRRATAPKAASKAKRATATRNKAAAKRSPKAASAAGSRARSRAKPGKATSKKKTAAATGPARRGKAPAKKSKPGKSAATTKSAGKKAPRAKAIKTRTTKPKASGKKATGAKATGKAKVAKRPAKTRRPTGTVKKATPPKKRK